MPTEFYSFGVRHGKPQTGPKDLVIDVRPLFGRNPYHDKRLRKLRGDHPDVIADIKKTPNFRENLDKLLKVVELHNGPVYLGCTGGHHRSVFLANYFADLFQVPVLHLNYDDK